MPTIKVPEITIPTVDIPSVPFVSDNVLTGLQPACDLVNRDLKITQNPTIVFYNRKQYATCPQGPITTTTPVEEDKTTAPKAEKQQFRSIVYDPNDTIETESSSRYTEGIPLKGVFMSQGEEKKEEQEPPPCPDLSRVLPVGSFTSDLRTSRIKEYIRADNGYDCVPILEEVTFLKSVLPTSSAALNIVAVSFIASTTPLLIPVIKAASKTFFKNVIKKLTKKKEKLE
tara:strand:+ start:8201 stop:8884 length:684 start_codon:yes stop_codon:yes gene_type:complete